MKALLAAVLLASPALGAETAAFLDIGPGARAIGLGGAYTALADDADAVYWNPAGLARLEKRNASLSHAELNQGNRHDFLSYAHPTSRAVLGAAFTYLSYGQLTGRDAMGRTTGAYNASDAAGAIGAGVKTEDIDFGGSIKFIQSHIGSAQASGVAFDAGVRREEPLSSGKLVIGASLRNMGPGLKYDGQRNDLPLRASFGGAYKFAGGHALAVELQNGPRGAGSEGGAGGEYQAMEGVFLRLGYTSKSAAADGTGFDAARGLTIGLGMKRGGYSLDYAAQAAGALGATHRFTLATRF
jgi:hypothetical protein